MPSAAVQRLGPDKSASVDLPLFDVSAELSAELGRKLVQGAAIWGFLWIAASPPIGPYEASTIMNDHGNGKEAGGGGGGRTYDMDEETVNKVFDISREFFKDARREEKEAVRIKNNKGWVDMHVENLDPSKRSRGDFKQAFNLTEAQPDGGEWRQKLPQTFRRNNSEAILRDFHAQCRRLAYRILRLLAMGLGLPNDDWLVESHEHSPFTSRLNYYPRLPPDTDYSPETDTRAGSHSDYGSITLLFQRDQPGLEILTPQGTWASVPVFPPNYHSSTFPPVVVNIADMLSYWTNGVLKSTIHRVVVVPESGEPDDDDDAEQQKSAGLGRDRYSIAIFIQPTRDTEIVPMPSSIVADRAVEFAGETVGHGGGSGHRTLTAGEYLDQRLQATYGAVYSKT